MRKDAILKIGLQLVVASLPYQVEAQSSLKRPSIRVEALQYERPRTDERRTDESPTPAGDDAWTLAGPRVGGERESATTASVNTEPTIAKDSVQIRAFTFSSYKKNYDIWSWVPDMKFSVNGPVDGGSRLYAEFTIPGSAPWLKFDCKTETTQAGFSIKTECGGRQIPEEKGSIYTGPVNFAIKLANELAGSDTTLFAGKMQVGKVRTNTTGPKTANHFVFYVDHDWNLPIAYLFYEGDNYWDHDRPERWAKPKFSIAFWTRGEMNGFATPHLFYGGKEVGKAFYNGKEVSVPDCSVDEVRNAPTHITSPEGQFIWTRRKCTFNNVIPWNKTRDSNETMFGRLHLFSENPGEYELKIMHNGRLIRTLKFAVDREGKLVDNSIAKGNKLGSDRMIVPVRVLGDADGSWNRTAWKTDAFYGNPLVGFSSP